LKGLTLGVTVLLLSYMQAAYADCGDEGGGNTYPSGTLLKLYAKELFGTAAMNLFLSRPMRVKSPKSLIMPL
jgi:hypothetical protein